MKQLNEIEELLPAWLSKQRWFSKDGDAASKARVVDSEELNDSWPKLVWTLVEIDGGATYQVPLGLRRRDEIGPTLLGHNDAFVGDVDVDGVPTVVYDALIDSDLNKVLFTVITEGRESCQTVRPIGVEQSNTSLIFDNRLILKVFRRLYEGANPDLEVTVKLTEAGFEHVAPVVAMWKRENHDLAVCQPYLWDGSDGWKLALASVRDFLGPVAAGGSATAGSVSTVDESTDPAAAGGDFGAEAWRLGEMTAEMHVALAREFPTAQFDATSLAASLESGLKLVHESQRAALGSMIDRVSALAPGSVGLATRVHGDYHLGQTLRAVSGWYVFDFEGEPARPLTERTLPTSPVKDVAGMVRSFHYATAAGLFEQMPSDRDVYADAARAWQERNSGAFRDGYMSVDGVRDLLPADESIMELLFDAFEIEKAIYELAYERAYRPDWVSIPESALSKLLGA